MCSVCMMAIKFIAKQMSTSPSLITCGGTLLWLEVIGMIRQQLKMTDPILVEGTCATLPLGPFDH